MNSEYSSIGVTDMSLTYLFNKNPDLVKANLVHYSYLLKKVGIDFAEISINLAEYILLKSIEDNNMFPQFILRIDSLKELDVFMNSDKNTLAHYEYITMPLKVYMSYINKYLNETVERINNMSIVTQKYNITIEINLEELFTGKCNNNSKEALLQALMGLFETLQINIIPNSTVFAIKVTGDFDCYNTKFRLIKSFFSKHYINTIICPDNNCHTATAVAVNAITSGVTDICGTLTGLHQHSIKLPVEEILMAATVLLGYKSKGRYEFFQELKKLFEKISGIALPYNKPILGSNIFDCESGIHVDGIIKATETYEPYPPERVGLKRKIVLGKHSGKKALIYVLNKNKAGDEKQHIVAK